MKYINLIKALCFVGGIYYSITELAQQHEIYFMSFVFTGCLSGFVIETIDLALANRSSK